ncbi:MAG: hypothetical protein AAB372_03395 [Patescibacteria group bacterium]
MANRTRLPSPAFLNFLIIASISGAVLGFLIHVPPIGIVWMTMITALYLAFVATTGYAMDPMVWAMLCLVATILVVLAMTYRKIRSLSGPL